MKDLFHRISAKVSNAAGSPYAFLLAFIVVLIWALSGPLFNYSPTWQLVINTGTTIVTFLMIFLVQNTQNRDSKAMHLKMDELIRTQRGARNSFTELETMSDEQLDALDEEFQKLHTRHDNQVTAILKDQLLLEKKRRSVTGSIASGAKHVWDDAKNIGHGSNHDNHSSD